MTKEEKVMDIILNIRLDALNDFKYNISKAQEFLEEASYENTLDFYKSEKLNYVLHCVNSSKENLAVISAFDALLDKMSEIEDED